MEELESKVITLTETQEAAAQKAVEWFKQTKTELNIEPFSEWCAKTKKDPEDRIAKIAYIGYMQRRARNCQTKFFNLFGYAGTGKTTIAASIVERIGVITQYIAPTGKAAAVLRRKGCDAITMHAFAYRPIGEDDDGQLMFAPKSEPSTMPQLIVLDEGSMVSERDAEQLLSFGIPILVLADPGQIDPVRGVGGFTKYDPDVLLTDVRRQDLDSKILHAATITRDGKRVPDREYNDISIKSERPTISELMDYIDDESQILAVRNATRVKFNNTIRTMREKAGEIQKLKHSASDLPVKGDKLISTFNDYERDVMNGMQWRAVSDCYENKDSEPYEVVYMDDHGNTKRVIGTQQMQIDVIALHDPDKKVTLPINPDCFFYGNDPEAIARRKEAAKRKGGFDFGYAITVHKSQGSEWSQVLFFEESLPGSNMQKLVYTAITRAQKFFCWRR